MSRMWISRIGFAAVAVLSVGVQIAACSDDPPPPPPPRVEQAGQACTSAAQCYPNIGDAAALKGAIECLAKVPGGYCTHLCNDDSDCCAVPGECKTGFKQVCSPFTNEATPKRCFLSCEAVDIAAASADAGVPITESNYCQTYAHQSISCRSSGGGAMNRKVCVP